MPAELPGSATVPPPVPDVTKSDARIHHRVFTDEFAAAAIKHEVAVVLGEGVAETGPEMIQQW